MQFTSFHQATLSPRKLTAALLSLGLLTFGATSFAADAPKAPQKPPTSRGALQEGFPFLTACVSAKFPAGNDANKGVAIRLAHDSAMLFDEDLLRFAAGWTGGYINPTGVSFDTGHGGHPSIYGDQQFATKPGPGWADASGSFADPRKIEPYGPIPVANGRYDGLYVVGDDIVVTYTVLGTKIFEQPSALQKDGQTAFVRTIQKAKNAQPLAMVVCDVDGASGTITGSTATLTLGNDVTMVGLVGAAKDAKLEIVDGTRVIVRFPKGSAAATFNVVIWKGAASGKAAFAGFLTDKPKLADYKKGGKQHWPTPIVTKGQLATSTTPDGAFVSDRITTPYPGVYSGNPQDWKDNIFKRRIMIGGLDFFSDGKRAAVSTWEGDIWIVSGLDESLEKITWKRFASGGYENLGLKIVNDVIYTTGRDQITRYYDFNNDGEADYYENFNNQATSSTGFHEFAFDLQTDKDGNFYTAKAGPVKGGGRGFGGGGGNGFVTEFAGTLQKISKDGKTREIYATGLRAPNGIGVGPDGQVTTSDNEGTWVPSTPINWVKKGAFLGVEDTRHGNKSEFQQPLCWLSHSDYDNSGGGQVWVTGDKWPFKGEMLHMSYGKCRLYLVMKEEVNGKMQGGVVQIPIKFTASAMRARFNPKDGQLYIVGLNGWQSSAANLTGFDRVRYTGKPVYSVQGLNVIKGGVKLTFSQPLDKASAEDLQNWSGKRWNYQRTEDYGSPEISVADPSKKTRDRLNITDAKLSADGKTVTLMIEDLKPVMQQSLAWKGLKTKDGTEISQDIQHTINVVP